MSLTPLTVGLFDIRKVVDGMQRYNGRLLAPASLACVTRANTSVRGLRRLWTRGEKEHASAAVPCRTGPGHAIGRWWDRV